MPFAATGITTRARCESTIGTDEVVGRCASRSEGQITRAGPTLTLWTVSYTHLTLPTICSV